MGLLFAIVVASCLSLASAALAYQQTPQQQDASSAPTSPTQQPPHKESALQGDKPAPQNPASATRPETNRQIKPEAKNKPDFTQSRARSKAPANGKRTPAASAPASTGAPRRIVVREGGAEEPETQIVSNMTPEQASRERQDTEDLLNSTRDILQGLSGRSLDPPRQETVSQIHNYMEGSRSALKEGDIARAHTLALKANLLADDLASH